MLLVDRKSDGFQDEICPEWKRDKQKLEPLFGIQTKFILEPISFAVNKYHQYTDQLLIDFFQSSQQDLFLQDG